MSLTTQSASVPQIEIPRRLVGRVCIVTGGGHGIGAAYARRLAREGGRTVIAELDGPAGDSVADEICAEGLEALAVQTDVTSESALETMVGKVMQRWGRIDVLVNNAAMFSTIPMSRSTFDRIDPAEWDRMMSINLKGVWLACRAVVPIMRQQQYGKIINISSGTALKGVQTRIHYVTTKAGILGFTKVLAREVGDANICVNCVAPGSTLSEINPDEATLKMREAAQADRALKRTQMPEDLTGAIAFFASPDSDFITGQTLVVDGGSHMH
ncbi:MAG: SDR family oxidoreductase [Chloroflexota bacterium]